MCFVAFRIPQIEGPRLGAFTILLWMFGVASLPWTYVLHFLFTVGLLSMPFSCIRTRWK